MNQHACLLKTLFPDSTVVGLNLFELLYWMPHGLPEFALTGGTFLVVGKRLTGSFRRPGGAYTESGKSIDARIPLFTHLLV